MTTLYLDLGNTKAKWLLSCGQSGSVAHSHLDQHVLQVLNQTPGLDQVVLASVLSEQSTQQVVGRLRRLGIKSIKRCMVTPVAGEVRCGYRDVDRLGVDRWLAVLAVWERCRGACLVVDLGTAATLDLVDGQGQHLGGFIVAGLNLAIDGLLQGTQNIRPDTTGFEAASLRPGCDTAAAIYNGALAALVALVETQYQKLLKIDSTAKLIIAGGDAPIVAPRLESDYVLVQELVFDGMKILERLQLLVEAD